MKALEKDRVRRYNTASAIAEDIQHHLNHEPVQARPPSTAYRTRKFIRRHRFGVAMVTTLTLALAVGLAAALVGFGQARRERDRAERLGREEATQRQRAEADEQKATAEASKSRQVARFLEDMLDGVGPSVARGRDTKMLREILDKTAERVAKDLKDQPEVEAELQYTMARVYWALGAYDKAEALHRAALSTRRKLRGNQDLDVAASLHELANVVESNYEPAQAEPMYREALAIRRKVLGNEHLDVAGSLRGLASALEFQGKLDEAEAGFREALALRRKLLGNEHPDVANALDGLAYTLGKAGKLDDAEALGREALTMHRKLLVTDHPELAMSMSALAQVLTRKGNLAEAETLFRESLEIRRRLLGNEHDLVYGTLANVGKSLLAQGKLAEAESAFRALLEGKAILQRGKAGWMLIDCAAGLTEVLKHQGRLAEIVTWYEDAQRLNLLAWFLAAVANPDARDGPVAVLIAQKAVAVTGRKDPAILDTLATAWAEAGQFTNAVNVQKEAIALLKDEEKKRDYASRLRLYESSIPYHSTGWLIEQLARLPRAGKCAEAEPLAREWLAIQERQVPDDWETFYVRSVLGRNLLGQQKYSEAEPLLLSGYQGMKQREDKIPMADKPRLKVALQRLVQLYETTGRPDQAAAWKQKLAEFEKAGSTNQPAAPPPAK